ncbi:MAG: dihydroorotase [Halofilum sp. (in: g-proteobacteria)]|nr:dihydroorotase [Halofilum sp. (in: g-proteobacteria)]
MSSLLIRNARIINEGRIDESDVLVEDGRIAAIGTDIGAGAARDGLDAAGRLLLPGLIDSQVHFREPGMEYKADIASESGAAVAGGITSYFEMPNTNPPTLSAEALEDKFNRAAGRSRANFAFYLGASHDNEEALTSIDTTMIPGVKIFMGSSTGNMLVDDPEVLDRIFSTVRIPIATHCEDTPTIKANEQAYRERYGNDLLAQHHPLIRTHEACWKSSSFAVELAKRHGTNLHILHLTTAREMELFEPGPIAGKHITAEACIHHLTFDDRDYAELGNRIKCNPAIKTREDREALLDAVRNDRIDILATDHAPHTLEEKNRPYSEAPAGMPLAQHLLPGLLDLVHRRELRIEQVVEKACHNVARRFGVVERGFIREGYHADLVLADPDATTEVRDDNVLAKCGWSPFAGRTLQGRVDATIVGGYIAWLDGRLTDTIAGQRVEFDH